MIEEFDRTSSHSLCNRCITITMSGVFTGSAKSTIKAPIETVWGVFTDFENYSKWNSFVRSQILTDASYKPLVEQKPASGRYLLMEVCIPPSSDPEASKSRAKCIIVVMDHEHHRAEWKAVGFPSFLLSAHRTQTLKEVEQENGEKVTVYETSEVFSGVLAYIIKWLLRAKLQKSFIAMAEDLKRHSEELHTPALTGGMS